LFVKLESSSFGKLLEASVMSGTANCNYSCRVERQLPITRWPD